MASSSNGLKRPLNESFTIMSCTEGAPKRSHETNDDYVSETENESPHSEAEVDDMPSPKKVPRWRTSLGVSNLANLNGIAATEACGSSLPADGKMRVFVRCRPENDKEDKDCHHRVVEAIDRQLLVFDPVVQDDEYFYKGRTYKEVGKKANKNLQFVFDQVFDDQATNLQVFESVTKSTISSFLDGYNCAVFAYGATGSGKTHTMLGSASDPGVMFFTTMELFRVIDSRPADEQLEISISYFEIYNEVVFDLLTPTGGKSLAVREDPKRGVIVSNLSVHQPKDAQHLLEMLEFGNRNRTQHPTDANAESSRSHAIFQVSLKKQDYSSSQQMSIQISKMSLIDLAGSERASVAYKEKRHKGLQREGANINKSLLALGNCINALANQSGPRKKAHKTHIPYRNSKLTMLLRDSLGGNCHTAMIATVSPSSMSYEDTHNTLTYANRAKGIQLNLKKNNVAVDLQPRNYTQAIDNMTRKINELGEENILLKQELNKLRNEISQEPKEPLRLSDSAVELLNANKNQLEHLFNERLDLRRQLMENQSKAKKIDFKLMMRKLDNERRNALTQRESGEVPNEPSAGLHNSKLHYSEVKDSLEKEIEQNQKSLDRLKEELLTKTGSNDWLILNYFSEHNLKADFKDFSYSEMHALDMSKELLSRLESNEEENVETMSLLRHFYMILNGQNRLTDDTKAKYDRIIRRIDGKKSVVWRDNPTEKTINKCVGRHELESIFSILPTTHSQNSAVLRTPTTSRKNSRSLTTLCSGLTPGFLPSKPELEDRKSHLHRDENFSVNVRTRGFGLCVMGGKLDEGDGKLYAYVSWTVHGGPADKMGLKPGDKILEWDGKSLVNLSYEQVCAIIDSSAKTAELIIEPLNREECKGYLFHQKRRLSQASTQNSIDFGLSHQTSQSPLLGNLGRRKLPRTPDMSTPPSTPAPMVSINQQPSSGELLCHISIDPDQAELTVVLHRARGLGVSGFPCYAQIQTLPSL
ncbi:Kinesin-like protein KIF18A [Halotydeus destructor]|nr:Kinesin-like protein KIF18A [Halotydeus destructor]